ncbi:MAG: hypothetical protein ACRDFQ_00750 [Anaerolineales bacterium]
MKYVNPGLHTLALALIFFLPFLSACQGGQVTIQVPGGGDDGGNGQASSDQLFTTQFLFVILLIMIVFVAMVAVLR